MSSEPTGARCTVPVWRGDRRWATREECGRPVERDGKCKMHLRVEARRAEWREDRERGDALTKEADELGAALGVQVEAHYNSLKGSYDGRFVVDGDWLRAQAGERP